MEGPVAQGGVCGALRLFSSDQRNNIRVSRRGAALLRPSLAQTSISEQFWNFTPKKLS